MSISPSSNSARDSVSSEATSEAARSNLFLTCSAISDSDVPAGACTLHVTTNRSVSLYSCILRSISCSTPGVRRGCANTFVPVCACREGHEAPGPRFMFHVSLIAHHVGFDPLWAHVGVSLCASVPKQNAC
eukprot:6187410-Prymnesium_polylepis.1